MTNERAASPVARTWIGRVPASLADDYLAYVERTGLPALRGTPGNRSAWVLRRVDGEVAEFQVISTWESEGAIRAFAGDPIEKARYYPEDRRFLLEMSETVDHWELIDEAAG